MRWSKSLIPTLKEDPADAEAISHKLMVRAGLVRQLAAGIYVYLPLGQRVMDKINAIIREEINAIGGQEITMPVIHRRNCGRSRAAGTPSGTRCSDSKTGTSGTCAWA
jgi:prolyl-tRNA synthetase